MIVALAALFVALSGTAYAANTIRSTDIVDGQVKTADLATGAVTSAKLKDGGVAGRDLAAGAVSAGKLAPGAAVSVSNSTTETASTASLATLHADQETFDSGAMHDQVTSTESLVAPVAGRYLACATVDWNTSALGYRRASIVSSNGTIASVAGPALPSPAFTSQALCGIDQLGVGQTVHVTGLQGSGGDLGVRLARFDMTFIGK